MVAVATLQDLLHAAVAALRAVSIVVPTKFIVVNLLSLVVAVNVVTLANVVIAAIAVIVVTAVIVAVVVTKVKSTKNITNIINTTNMTNAKCAAVSVFQWIIAVLMADGANYSFIYREVVN